MRIVIFSLGIAIGILIGLFLSNSIQIKILSQSQDLITKSVQIDNEEGVILQEC